MVKLNLCGFYFSQEFSKWFLLRGICKECLNYLARFKAIIIKHTIKSFLSVVLKKLSG